MAFQPFALDRYFEDMIKGGISQGKDIEQWFAEKSDEATLELAEETEKIKKKMKGAKGFFDKHLGGWGKTALGFVAPWAIPIMATVDAAKRQNQYKKRLKDLKKLRTKKGKYAGTFLQDYFERGMEGIKGQTTKALEGLKQADLITGLLDVGVSVIPGLSKLGKGNVLSKLGEVGKEAKESLKDKLIEGAKNVFGGKTAYADAVPQSDKFLNRLFAGIEKGINKTPLNLDFATNYAGESIMDQGLGSSIQSLGTGATKSAGKNIFNTEGLKKIFDLATGGVSGAYDIATTPLIKGGTDTIGSQLISSLSTPSTYSPVIRDEYMKYINPQEEAAVVRAQSPYQRYRV